MAKAFKILDIIVKDDNSCSNFLPYDFSKKSDSVLKLTPGTYIQEDQLIILEFSNPVDEEEAKLNTAFLE